MRKQHPVIYLLDDSGCFVRCVRDRVFVFIFVDAMELTHTHSHTEPHAGRQRGARLAAH